MSDIRKIWFPIEPLESGMELDDAEVRSFVSWLNHQLGEADFMMRIGDVSVAEVFPSYLKSEDPEWPNLPESEQLQHMITERIAFAVDGNGIIELPGDWMAEELNTTGGHHSCTERENPLVTGFTVMRNDMHDSLTFDVRISQRTYPADDKGPGQVQLLRYSSLEQMAPDPVGFYPNIPTAQWAAFHHLKETFAAARDREELHLRWFWAHAPEDENDKVLQCVLLEWGVAYEIR